MKKNGMVNVLQKFSALFILIVLITYMALSNGNFFQVSNFVNIIKQSSVLGIMAIGQTLVILTAGIDLSVGSMMALSGCTMAVANTQWGFSPVLSVIVGLLFGMAAGFINGIVITKGRIQAFIATLGMLQVAEGVSLLFTDGLPISGINEGMLKLGSGLVWGIPISVFAFLAVVVLGYIFLNMTTAGRNVIAVGGNEEASRTSGIRVDGTKIIVHTLSGLCCAIGGFVMIGRLNSANGLMGSGMELQAITAVALGGTSLAGGLGGIGGTVIGVITIGVLNNGLDLLNTTPFWQKVILGIIIVLVVILDSWRSRKFHAQ
jgi:ribose/xylose/arabinose/galactoside ABC-type transport system permease subunit